MAHLEEAEQNQDEELRHRYVSGENLRSYGKEDGMDMSIETLKKIVWIHEEKAKEIGVSVYIFRSR